MSIQAYKTTYVIMSRIVYTLCFVAKIVYKNRKLIINTYVHIQAQARLLGLVVWIKCRICSCVQVQRGKLNKNKYMLYRLFVCYVMFVMLYVGLFVIFCLFVMLFVCYGLFVGLFVIFCLFVFVASFLSFQACLLGLWTWSKCRICARRFIG